MSDSPNELPPLDCHAHINPTVTAPQIATLGGANVFAVTRSLAESEAASRRQDPTLTWGIGVHPGRADALAGWDHTAFERLVDHGMVFVGEIGLDRGGDSQRQAEVLHQILRITAQAPALLSLHSVARQREVLAMLAEQPQRGAILHWYTGDAHTIRQGVDLGCYFSANAAMSDAQLSAIPLSRMLPETDFPSSKTRTRARRPGDIDALETKMASLHRLRLSEVRQLWYRNLGSLTDQAGVSERITPRLRQAIAVARRP